jgi:hypothetical protein
LLFLSLLRLWASQPRALWEITKDKLETSRSEIVVTWRFRADGKTPVLAAGRLAKGSSSRPKNGSGVIFFEKTRTQVAVFRCNPSEIGEPRESAALEIIFGS